MSVRTVVGHCVKGIYYRNYSGQDWDALPAQSIRVSFSIPTFMMMANLIRNSSEFVIAVGDFVSLFRVRLKNSPFLFRKLARLIQDFQRDSYLADIVQ